MGMKKCDKIKGLFGAYLHDDVTSAERATVEEHIGNCGDCAADLHSRQKVLEILKPDPHIEDVPEKVQDDFSYNVYRRIAADSMKQRSRQVRMRRFVLQPAFAAAALSIVLIIGVLQFYPVKITITEPETRPLVADRRVSQERRAAKLEAKEREFFERQGILVDREEYTITGNVSTRARIPSKPNDPSQDFQLSDSQRQLQYATFLDYSLEEPRRALAAYRQLVDEYPGTDAARQASRRIRAISGMEYGIQLVDIDEEQIPDMGI
jgi:hypothetical protein